MTLFSLARHFQGVYILRASSFPSEGRVSGRTSIQGEEITNDTQRAQDTIDDQKETLDQIGGLIDESLDPILTREEIIERL